MTDGIIPRIKKLEKQISSTVPQSKLNECVDRALNERKLVHSDELKTQVEDAMKSHKPEAGTSGLQMNPGSPTSPGSQMTRCVDKVAAEVLERAKRETNIVIFGLSENETNNLDEVVRKDKETLGKLLTDVLKTTIKTEELKIVTRLGKKDTKERREQKPSESKYLPRPVKITFTTPQAKDQIFRNISKLKGSTFDRISIRHDMTTTQRKETDKLRDKARSMENEDSSKNFQYRVRGPPGNQRVAKINVQTRMEEPQ